MHISIMLSTNQDKTAKEKIICYQFATKNQFYHARKKDLEVHHFFRYFHISWEQVE
jgi:hypothetical protein